MLLSEAAFKVGRLLFTKGGAEISYGTAAPTSAGKRYNRGSIVWNSSVASGQPIGWMCSVAGSPGTWIALANL